MAWIAWRAGSAACYWYLLLLMCFWMPKRFSNCKQGSRFSYPSVFKVLQNYNKRIRYNSFYKIRCICHIICRFGHAFFRVLHAIYTLQIKDDERQNLLWLKSSFDLSHDAISVVETYAGWMRVTFYVLKVASDLHLRHSEMLALRSQCGHAASGQ